MKFDVAVFVGAMILFAIGFLLLDFAVMAAQGLSLLFEQQG